MSLAHFSPSNHHLPETLWYHPYPVMDSDPKIPNHSGFNFNINNNNTHYLDDNNNNNTQQQQENVNNSKEPMFEKPLTPSDVGKLNRLVIPKQHAEKYFPLANGNGNGDVDQQQQQKGLLLSFEDEAGKPWRFRYSYWNSSQSYVLTKGWSRFVKEKRLDAGDVVLFERHRFDCDRLFIGWRRRPAAASAAVVPMLDGVAVGGGGGGGGQMVGNGWTTGSNRGFYDAQYNYPSHHHHLPLSLSSPHPYQPHCLHAAGGGGINDNVENKQRDMVSAPRRVRLFGVNLECPDESEPSTPDGSSHGQTHYQYHNNLNLNHDMNINFSQMRYQQHQG